ncbi:IPT/TIG domain-containing protein [Pontibacter indicus]|uniref:Por secretion system C-terminal sorting domain-containing protein n=1 Tax=Pontibacter indicus TaxID=1317125 RepID=A0A1R3XCV1_9BACT|nr:IPT/TIG domain-containing protein [Pontibacter indicus]SIT88980.1 Por secretion system C-terminal sorting domain-containing protein [Pontibacter indicus]
MAQLYNPTLSRLIRTLLLQCVFMLGMVSVGMAQATLPINHDGPWTNTSLSGMNVVGNVIAGQDLEGGSNGSAQFREGGAYIDINFQNASSTDFKLSYSLRAATTRNYTASFTVSYSTDGGSAYTTLRNVTEVDLARETKRFTDLIPAAATNIRFTLNSATQAYILFDALELIQTPEILSIKPTTGVPGTQVTITGNRLNDATVKFGGIAVPATLVIKDGSEEGNTVTGVTVNAVGTEIIAYVPYGVGPSSPITVTTQYGTTTEVAFTVPAPTFNTPAFSSTSGIAGETIELLGNNFIDATAVLFNGATAEFKVNSNNKITVTIPNLASTGKITLTTPAGSVESPEFTVPSPEISSFTPTGGKSGVTEVKISGAYFHNVTEVKFNGVIAPGFRINETNDEITVNIPLGASTGPITVTSPAGTATSADPFEVPAPIIVAREIAVEGETVVLEFNPTRTGAGKTITIYGENLASVSRVVFPGGAGGEGANGTNLVKNTDTELTVTVPADASTGKLQLIADGYEPVESSQIFEFVPAPVIVNVTPIYGIVTTAITITGSNFQDATSVKIGNGEVTSGFNVNAEGTEIKLSIPSEATTGTVSVTTPLGGTGVWGGTFDVILAPADLAFTPASGPIGQEVKLTGKNLKYVTEVIFLGANNTEDEGDASVTFTTPNGSDTELTFNVPANTPQGLTKLLVRNAADDVITTNEFEVILRPVVNTLTPTMGIAGAIVVLEGYNFSNVTEVTFGGIKLTEEGFTVNAEGTQITVAVPANAPVTSAVIITNEFGNSVAKDFIVIQKPSITSFTEERGIVGDDVIITGTNFYGNDDNPITVSFAGANGSRVNAEITAMTPTQITVKVPTGAITGGVIVTNAADSSEPSEDYIVATNPEIFSFTPASGKVGDDVSISGWLMESVTYVAFNGTKASVTPSADGRTIKVKVPAGATTGRLALFVGEDENPVFTTAEDQIFTVIPAPTIVSVNPNSGVGGTVVTITGTNFIDITSVTFNDVAADASKIAVNETFTVLTVTVPTTATTGALVVNAGAGEATHENFIVPTPAAITFTNNTATPLKSYANQLVTIRGQYFTNAIEVDFNGKKITTGITVVDEVEGSTEADRFQLITVKAPFDAGTGKITVTTPAGSGVSTDDYTVLEPKIASISATEGYAAQTVLTITGELFTQYWNETLNSNEGGEGVKAPIVKFNGAQIEATNYAENGTSITVTVPGSARTGSVTVVSGSGESEPVQFNVLAPVLSSVTPTAVYAGQTVTISGTNFINVTSMSYGNIPITGYDIVLTDTEKGTGTITFVAPKINHNTTNTLSVTSTSGTGSTDVFTIYRPVISNVFETGKESPADRRVYAGVNTVTIKGTRFDEFWNGTVSTATPSLSLVRTGTNGAVTAITDFKLTQGSNETDEDVIVATIPASVTAGDYFIRIGSQSGVGQSSGTAGTITVLGTPTITGLSKVVGIVGDELTINGTFFDDLTKVTFLGIEGEEDEVVAVDPIVTSTSITVKVPTGATIGKIAVTTPFGGGEGTTVESSIFRVVKAPIVYDFNAKQGPSGTVVTITGENLIAVDGKIKVSFKGHDGDIIPAPLASQIELNATVNTEDLTTARSITVTVPVDAITGVITLANEVGTTTTAQAKDSDGIYTVTSPVVVRFERASDNSVIDAARPARLLETVNVKGYNLVGVQSLRIGSRNVFGYYEEDQHTLELLVPRNASRGIVTVTTVVGEDASERILEIVRPNITVDPAVLSFKAAVETEGVTTYDVKSYTVTATNLAVGQNLTISLSENMPYLLSLNPNSTAEGTWMTGMTLPADENGNLTQVVYARNNSTIVANDESSRQTVLANHTSLEATTRTVTLQSEIIPLPVELIAFNARKESNGVQLTWATASELDNDYFEVQMTEDLKGEFKAVGKVKSNVNTTALRQDYQFNHKGNFNGTRYYRLKQVDLDGTFEYSKVVAVSSNGVNLAVGPRVYPNPINADSKLVYNADRAGKLNVRIVNMNGSAVQNLSYDIEEGENTILLNLNNNLPTGIYILMTEFNGKTEQVKLMKQ